MSNHDRIESSVKNKFIITKENTRTLEKLEPSDALCTVPLPLFTGTCQDTSEPNQSTKISIYYQYSKIIISILTKN